MYLNFSSSDDSDSSDVDDVILAGDDDDDDEPRPGKKRILKVKGDLQIIVAFSYTTSAQQMQSVATASIYRFLRFK